MNEPTRTMGGSYTSVRKHNVVVLTRYFSRARGNDGAGGWVK